MDIDQAIDSSKLVVCDFDGVLVKLDVDWDAVRQRLRDETDSQRFEKIDPDLRRIRRVDPEAFDYLCDIIAEAEINGFVKANTELIEKLKGKPLAIFSSNTRKGVITILKRREFRGLRPLVIAKCDVKKGKPNPEGLVTIWEQFHVPMGEMIFIGDTEDDKKAGKLAGVRTIILEAW